MRPLFSSLLVFSLLLTGCTELSGLASPVKPAPSGCSNPGCDCTECDCGANCDCVPNDQVASKPSLQVYTAPFTCPPCDLLKANIKKIQRKGYWSGLRVPSPITGYSSRYPRTQLFDKKGRMVYEFYGSRSEDELRKIVRSKLGVQ